MAKRMKEVPMAETPNEGVEPLQDGDQAPDTASEPDGKTAESKPASQDEMATLADDSARAVLRKRLETLESKTILTIQDGAEIKRLRKALTQE